MQSISTFFVHARTVRVAESHDDPAIHRLVQELYMEDQKIDIDSEHMQRTLAEFRGFPEKGCVLVFEQNKNIIGYTILVNFWSNEYGGNILNIDEIFLLPEYRGKGFGTAFIQSLIEQRPYDAVALQLETTPANARAKKLYEKLGFRAYPNESMLFEYDHAFTHGSTPSGSV